MKKVGTVLLVMVLLLVGTVNAMANGESITYESEFVKLFYDESFMQSRGLRAVLALSMLVDVQAHESIDFSFTSDPWLMYDEGNFVFALCQGENNEIDVAYTPFTGSITYSTDKAHGYSESMLKFMAKDMELGDYYIITADDLLEAAQVLQEVVDS